MSKLLKSKFLLGVVMVAVVSLGVYTLGAPKANAQQAVVSASDIQYAATVRSGSSGQSSLIWQKFLNGYSSANLVADGKFGPLSEASAKIWQASRNLSADGVLGAMSRASAVAQINSGVTNPVGNTYPAGCSSSAGYSSTTGLPCTSAANYPAGCTSAVGYSSVTGLPCTSVGSYPAGCTSNAGYSSTTGLACSGVVTYPAGCTSAVGYSTTTGLACSGTVVSSNGEGSIALSYAAIPANTTIMYKGQNNQAFIGLEVKASGSDMKVNRMWLNFDKRIWLDASNISLWDGATQLGTIALSASTVVEYTTGAEWQVQFNGLNVVVPVGTTKTLTAKFDRPLLTQNSDTATNMTANSSIRTVDGAAFSDVTNLAARVINFQAATASTGLLAAQLSSTSPAVGTVSGLSSTAGVLTAVKLTDFNLKATQSDINVTNIHGAVNISSGTLTNMVASLELRDGTNVLSSVAGSATPDFTDLNINVLKDQTKVLSVWAQMYPVTGTPGAGVTTSGAGFSADITVNNTLLATDTNWTTIVPTGSVAGNYQYMYQYAPTVTLVSAPAPTVTLVNPQTNGKQLATGYLSFSVTANGQDEYITATPNGSTSGLVLVKEVADNTPSGTTYTFTQLDITSTDAVNTGGVFKIPNGTTKTFVANYSISVAGANGYNGAKLSKLNLTSNTNGITGVVDFSYALPTAIGPQAFLAYQ